MCENEFVHGMSMNLFKILISQNALHFGRNTILKFSLLPQLQLRLHQFTEYIYTMAEYFKYLKQMLSLVGESFKDELKCLGFSVTQLNPMEVLSALLHAEKQLGCESTKEEFKSGAVGSFMLPEDFKPKESVSTTKLFLIIYIFPWNL